MRSIILIGLTFFMLVSAAWTTSLVCYQPAAHDLDPLAPIVIKVALQ